MSKKDPHAVALGKKGGKVGGKAKLPGKGWVDEEAAAGSRRSGILILNP